MNLYQSRGWRRVAVTVAATVSAALVAGCGSSTGTSAGSGEVDKNAHLRITYPVARSLDPAQAPEPAQLTIATWPVYDRLIQVNAKAQYEPMLATKWEFSADGKALTLSLRDDVTFSDGTKFDASAVKANLDHYTASTGTALGGSVADIDKVDVVDATTVKVGLKRASTTVLSTLASTLGGLMISPKALKSPDLATKPVGTGAYVIDSYQPGTTITYKRRTDKGGIWDDKTGKPAKVTVTTMAVDAATNAIKGGQADVIVWSGDSKPFANDISAGKLQHNVMAGVLNMVGFSMNMKKKPYDDVAVRQAVNLAIDREAIVKAFLPDTAARVQPWPNGLPGFEKSREDTYKYDPAKAKQVLKDAGYTGDIDAGELLVANTGAMPPASEVIQANLAEVGIKIKLRPMDIYALITEWAKGQGSAEIAYMTLPSADAFSWLNRLFTNPVWIPGGAPADVVAGIQGLDDPSMSDADRAAGVSKVIDQATEQALYAPLWQGVGGFVSSVKVKNLDKLASVNGGVADLRNTYMTK